MSTSSVQIGSRLVGSGHKAYIIAEMSANHNGNFDYAVNMIKEMSMCGADAVKIQTFTADSITIDCDSSLFKPRHSQWAGLNLFKLYEKAAMPFEWQPKLKKLADELSVDFISTPVDSATAVFLDDLVCAYKVASFELVDIPFLKSLGAMGKPVILSTGMATLAEIEEAVEAVRSGGTEVVLLKCTSAYPAVPEEANLRTIPHLSQAFHCPVGLSDHTKGITVPVAAVALGASVIEKHFMLPDVEGLDKDFSLTPQEFKDMVDSVRNAEAALGAVHYGPTERELAGGHKSRRSLFVVKDMEKGEVFSDQNVRSIRPGAGMKPKYFEKVLGKVATRDVERGTPLSWDLLG
ncbi:pseudaminic acid synthase [Desulfovibrio subterraneus]|uniref:pseudaminic acid synthase n=1 Tax=Desulfovibrio subterraneus TaxID=2718620 RepID=UPI001FB1895C|nr:pseudaminic acid synthase [Desulfovibrio subterraneus]